MKNGKIPIDDKGNPIFKADKNLPDIGQENGFLFIFKSNRNTSTPLNFQKLSANPIGSSIINDAEFDFENKEISVGSLFT